MKQIMKQIMKLFMKLYHKPASINEDGIYSSLDFRNIGHGFLIGFIGWFIAFFTMAEILNYENWPIYGAIFATISSWVVAVLWESYQNANPDKRFSWRDVWASNFWFIILFIFTNMGFLFFRKEYTEASKEFSIWFKEEGRFW